MAEKVDMEAGRCCVVCRKRGERGRLLRFVRMLDGEICFDLKANLPSRGAWLCPHLACLDKAFAKRLLFRTERTLPINGELMKEGMRQRLEESIIGGLGLLRRMGRLVIGRDMAKGLLSGDEVVAILLAADLAPRSQKEMKEALERSDSGAKIFIAPILMSQLDAGLGREKTGVVAILKSRITDEILWQLKVLTEILGLPREAKGQMNPNLAVI